MAWTLGLDNLRGPADDEDVGSAHPSSESLYYGPPQNGTRREWGVPPRNGRNLPPCPALASADVFRSSPS
jgi:hypothetical protein